jgi:hypothetical protein
MLMLMLAAQFIKMAFAGGWCQCVCQGVGRFQRMCRKEGFVVMRHVVSSSLQVKV